MRHTERKPRNDRGRLNGLVDYLAEIDQNPSDCDFSKIVSAPSKVWSAFYREWRTGMLVLSRNIGDSIHIGDDIALTVLDVQGNQVRIGISAPREVPVHREEIYHRIKQHSSAIGWFLPLVCQR